jgi:site-specific recombinase XerD
MSSLEHVPLPRYDGLSPVAAAAVAAGMPESTRAAYLADVTAFARWCTQGGHCGLPANAETLAEYATFLAYGRHLAPKSIERARWAIRKAHEFAGAPVPASGKLAEVLKGYRRHLGKTKDPKARSRKASAADKDVMAAMLAGIDLRSPGGKRDAALILLGFATAGRRSEVAALDIPDVQEAGQGLLVSLFRIKTVELQEIAVPYAKDTALCPVTAVTRWLNCLDAAGRTDGPIFVRVDRHGNLAAPFVRHGQPIGDPTGRMTPQAVAQVIDRRARAAGLGSRFSGHSLRRGFATEAHRTGVKKLRIARHGGWDDDSAVLDGYIEDADQWDDNALNGVL